MGILISAFAEMFRHQRLETRALSEKLAAMDLMRFVTATISNPALCSSIFAPTNITNSSVMPFNSSSITPSNPYTFSINTIPSGNPSQPAAVAGSPVSPLASSLIVDSATSNPPGLQIQVTSPTTANLVTNFDKSKLVHSIQPLTFSLQLKTSGPVNSLTIDGCAGKNVAVQILVSLATLGQYIGSTDRASMGWDGTCAPIVSTAKGNFFMNSACSRFCSGGCNPPGCDSPQPGQGYSVGSITECDYTILSAQCSCVP